MPIVVTIDLAEPPSPPLVRELEAACEAALPEEGRCTVGADGARRVVVVWLDEARTRALVRSTDASGRPRERVLVFTASDPEAQRWRSIGFAAGTLVDATPVDARPPAAPPPSAAPPPPPPAAPALAPQPPTSEPPRGIAASISLVALRGAAGSLAAGAELRAGADVGTAAWTAAVGGTLDRDVGPLETRFLWLSAGPEVRLVRLRRGRVSARVELFVEELTVEHHASTPVESRSRVMLGARAAPSIELPLAGWLHVVAATSVGARTGETHLRLGDRDASRVGVLRVDASLGAAGRF